jgi:hypothetical protein
MQASDVAVHARLQVQQVGRNIVLCAAPMCCHEHAHPIRPSSPAVAATIAASWGLAAPALSSSCMTLSIDNKHSTTSDDSS